MEKYKAAIDNTEGRHLYPSDRKRLLGLPFLMAKRSERPAPKKGQKEWDLFYEMFGNEYDKFDGILFDKEDKITEFNYENYLPQPFLKTMDTQSEDFKIMIKQMNFNSKT